MISTIIKTARPPFLILTITSVLLALAWADYQQIDWSGWVFFLVVIGALFAHISVNMLNEYEDYKSGLDAITDKTSFSGGSGSLQDSPQFAETVALIGYGLLGAVVSIGIFFIYLRGWGILPIGIVGILLVASYASWITRFPWLCLFSAGFAFGPLMVNGTYFVLTGDFDSGIFILSMIPFFLVNNLLLLNQIPDFDADKIIGRYNFLHKYGVNAGVKIYLLNWLFAFTLLMFLAVPYWGVIILAVLLISIPLLRYVFKIMTDREGLNITMGLNVALTLLTPALISLGLLLG